MDEPVYLEEIRDFAWKTLRKDGELSPQIFLIHNNGKVETQVLGFHDDEGKEITLNYLRERVQKEGITRYFTMMLAWCSQNTDEQKPSESDDRREVLMVSEYRKDNKNKTIIDFLERDDKRNVKLVESITNFDEIHSRWNFFLEDAVDEILEGYSNDE